MCSSALPRCEELTHPSKSLPTYAAWPLVTVGSRLTRALQSLIVSIPILTVWAVAQLRQSLISSSATRIHGSTRMRLVRSQVVGEDGDARNLEVRNANMVSPACENNGFVTIVPFLIKNLSTPSVLLHHAHGAFASSILVVCPLMVTHIEIKARMSLKITRSRPRSVLSFIA